jgi:hypothetical protein
MAFVPLQSTDLDGDVEYKTSNVNGVTVAHSMQARNLKLKMGKTTLSTYNAVTEDKVPAWNHVKNNGMSHPNGAPLNYVRLHLLNGKVGGSGADACNLAVGTGDLNVGSSSSHEGAVEKPIKEAIMAKKKIDNYYVECKYNTGKAYPMQTKSNENEWQRTLKSLHCQWEVNGVKAPALEVQETKNLQAEWNTKGC